MQLKIRAALVVAAVAGLGLGLAGTASAAPPAGLTSFRTPVKGGLLLNALGWGGTGSRAKTLANGGVVNDPIGVWQPSTASVASDFSVVPVTFQGFASNTSPSLSNGNNAACNMAGGCFLLEYAPGNHLSGMCVSTVTDVQGAYARLRNCASSVQLGDNLVGSSTGDTTQTVANTNQWQDFSQVNAGDGFFQLQAVLEATCGMSHQGCVLNDAKFGGDGSPVISWPVVTSENQLWEQVAAAS